MRVLVVEDTVDVAEGVVAAIERLGHVVDWAADGNAAQDWLAGAIYDLIVLDLMLPDADGVSLLREIRTRGLDAAVLVVTARAAVSERVQVLDLGADDYLCKPFDFDELQARIRSLLRRQSGDRTNDMTCGRLVYDRGTRLARIGQEVLALSPRELSLLEMLLAGRNRVLSKANILERLFDWRSDASENAVEVLVGRLRRKIEGSGAVIINHRGLGYQFRAE
jgi:two-component system response regulator TctD